jgi:alpha-galactosidase
MLLNVNNSMDHLRKLVLALVFCSCFFTLSCSRSEKPAVQPAAVSVPSTIKVVVNPGGPISVVTSRAQFEVLPSGYIDAHLLKDGGNLTLDDPPVGVPSNGDYLVSGGKEIHFVCDFNQARVAEATGKLGRGKRIEIPAHPLGPSGTNLHKILGVEVYDDFPNVLFTSVEYKNTGSTPIQIDRVLSQQHRLNAAISEAPTLTGSKKLEPYEMWSFHGSSYDWGKDDVFKVVRTTAQPNVMGEMVKGGYGGGIPVVAFWTGSVGEAIGHVETIPIPLAIPVKVEPDGRVNVSVSIDTDTSLQPSASYSTPRTFVAVYSGDFYEPLRMWSRVLQKEGWELPKPSSEAYNISWCGWGYEFNVTPAQMLGTVPKLKELGIKWATLDDRWFDTYGDWNPRQETFPGDSIKKMVDDFHKQGILVQLWWLPLAAEDGENKWESHKYIVSKVAKEHPDWFILNKDGKHAHFTRGLAILDPALPEVQAYYKQLTERFIRDWGFDGSKLDNIYSVPACYNPAHHHKSPQDSINAMADVYKTIFQTTRAIKPNSVTQSCPCGTPPSLAWLPFMDQAVTADPVGAVQVRRRIKMYKALLGPESAVYGDHVELSEMTRQPKGEWLEHGSDFASTIGAGGVVGTKFVWPDPGPKYKNVLLTPEKEELWKKWTTIYNDKMLSKGTFLNLYTYGYDVPEGYAIAKDGRMYYAFFAPSANAQWTGEVELRGLKAGEYEVMDYGNGKDLGSVHAVDGQAPKLAVEFKDHLLLQVQGQASHSRR